MEVSIYIGFWTLKIKCTQNELYGQAAFKNARFGQGRDRLGSGAEALAFSVLPLPTTLTQAMLVGGIKRAPHD